ncbi:MAG TPA: hypothetical protein VG798_05335 [Rhizomicrobium sp.]|nr:hypothetical protein [Rhizomicrobium sp.]
MRRTQQLLVAMLGLAALLALGGCYSDQKKQLAACKAGATRTGNGEPLRSTRRCMDEHGYAFVGFANTQAETVECDLAALIEGRPSETGTDALCFQPKGWWQLKLYRLEVPVKHGPVVTSEQQ